MASVVASRYAKALVDVVLKAGSELQPLDAIDQIRSFEELYASSSDLKNILLSPAVPGIRKRAVIARFAKDLRISRQICNFLYVVVDHRRIAELTELREAFEALLDERVGIVRVMVSSAQDMKDGQREALSARLASLTGKQVRASFAVDESLLGGAVARIGSTIYDGSVKGQLEVLRHRLESE
jgi:F-type H+-transporting ATPase subunit delta